MIEYSTAYQRFISTPSSDEEFVVLSVTELAWIPWECLYEDVVRPWRLVVDNLPDWRGMFRDQIEDVCPVMVRRKSERLGSDVFAAGGFAPTSVEMPGEIHCIGQSIAWAEGLVKFLDAWITPRLLQQLVSIWPSETPHLCDGMTVKTDARAEAFPVNSLPVATVSEIAQESLYQLHRASWPPELLNYCGHGFADEHHVTRGDSEERKDCLGLAWVDDHVRDLHRPNDQAKCQRNVAVCRRTDDLAVQPSPATRSDTSGNGNGERAVSLDVTRLGDGLCAGLAWLNRHHKIANALNVCPARGGDTGTNMLLVELSACGETADDNLRAAGAVARGAAHRALMGARGNSGVVLSQILHGMSRSMDDRSTVTRQFASALAEGSRMTYKGVNRPVQSTVLEAHRTFYRHMAEGEDAALAQAASEASAAPKSFKGKPEPPLSWDTGAAHPHVVTIMQEYALQELAGLVLRKLDGCVSRWPGGTVLSTTSRGQPMTKRTLVKNHVPRDAKQQGWSITSAGMASDFAYERCDEVVAAHQSGVDPCLSRELRDIGQRLWLWRHPNGRTTVSLSALAAELLPEHAGHGSEESVHLLAERLRLMEMSVGKPGDLTTLQLRRLQDAVQRKDPGQELYMLIDQYLKTRSPEESRTAYE